MHYYHGRCFITSLSGKQHRWQVCRIPERKLPTLCLPCRVHAQVVLQALLKKNPVLCEQHSQLAAASRFFDTAPSMRKLEKMRQLLLRELEKDSSMSGIEDIFDQVLVWLLWKVPQSGGGQ